MDMSTEHHKRVIAWIEKHRVRLGMNKAELARRIGLEPSKLGHSMGKKARKITAVELERLAEVFGERFGMDATNKADRVAQTHKSINTVSLGEKIAYGFVGHSIMVRAKKIEIPPVLNPRYLSDPQEAMPVEDDSADLYAEAGTFVIVVDYWRFRPRPQVGDKVVIKRYHPVLFRAGDMSQSENSIRLIEKNEKGFVLRSLSSNSVMKDIDYDPSDKSTVITKLIIGRQSYENY
jgi:hypothetical protein